MGQDEPEAVLLLRVSLAGAHAVSVLCAREGADRREVQHAALAVVRLAPFVAARPGKHRVERPQAPAVHLSAREAAQSRTARYLFGCLALNVHVLYESRTGTTIFRVLFICILCGQVNGDSNAIMSSPSSPVLVLNGEINLSNRKKSEIEEDGKRMQSSLFLHFEAINEILTDRTVQILVFASTFRPHFLC